MNEPLVSVRGEALVEVDPETAQVNVAVGARDKHTDETLRRLDERSSAVLALVASFGEAVERVETSGVRIGPEFKDGKPNERIQGYSAVIRHTLVVVDFDRLGDLVARLAELELVDVAGPWWALRRDSPHYREARRTAARQAVERARDYAEALGSRVTGLVELADTGLLSEAAPGNDGWRNGPSPVAPAPMAMRAAATSGAAPQPVAFDLEPVKQVVRASVEGRFVIAPPPEGSL